MSKHNKYKNNFHNSNLDTNTENVVENNDMENSKFEVDETVDTASVIEEETNISEEVSVLNNDEEVIDTLVVSNDIETEIKEVINTNTDSIDESKKTVFYTVGTNYVDNRCLNQVTITANLEDAKVECDKARDTQRKTYRVFNEYGNVVYRSEYTTPKDNYYRVGTDWKNGVCINQKLRCANLDEACTCANASTKLVGVVHNVYDSTGKVVFTAKKKLILLSYKKRGNKNVNWYTK